MKRFVTLNVVDTIQRSDSFEDIETGNKKCMKIRPEMISAFWPKESREIRSVVMVVFPGNDIRYWTVDDDIFDIERKIEEAENEI